MSVLQLCRHGVYWHRVWFVCVCVCVCVVGGSPEFYCKREGRLSLTTAFVIFFFFSSQIIWMYPVVFVLLVVFLSVEKNRMPLGKCNVLALPRSRMRPKRAAAPLYVVRNIIHLIGIVNWLII
jgi:hypothetical protein